MEDRIKKKFKWGSITQKMMSFKVDIDLLEKLSQEINKGRLINNLLRDHYEMWPPEEDEDASPDEHSIEEYQT